MGVGVSGICAGSKKLIVLQAGNQSERFDYRIECPQEQQDTHITQKR